MGCSSSKPDVLEVRKTVPKARFSEQEQQHRKRLAALAELLKEDPEIFRQALQDKRAEHDEVVRRLSKEIPATAHKDLVNLPDEFGSARPILSSKGLVWTVPGCVHEGVVPEALQGVPFQMQKEHAERRVTTDLRHLRQCQSEPSPGRTKEGLQ